MNEPMWSNLGQLEFEINRLRQDVISKVNGYELDSINERMGSIERSISDLESKIDTIRCGLMDVQCKSEE